MSVVKNSDATIHNCKTSCASASTAGRAGTPLAIRATARRRPAPGVHAARLADGAEPLDLTLLSASAPMSPASWW